MKAFLGIHLIAENIFFPGEAGEKMTKCMSSSLLSQAEVWWIVFSSMPEMSLQSSRTVLRRSGRTALVQLSLPRKPHNSVLSEARLAGWL